MLEKFSIKLLKKKLKICFMVMSEAYAEDLTLNDDGMKFGSLDQSVLQRFQKFT